MTLFSFLNLILHFDGSLRSLSEVDKINGIPPSLITLSRKQIATCAASITSDDGNIIAVGVKRIRRSVSSADVEYEGLILGLQLIQSKGVFDKYVDQVINVRGDCKTVIDQMNSKSFARKQVQYFQEAKELVNQICNSNRNVFFEHVSRDLNSLCDSSCDILQRITQIQDIRNYELYLQKLDEEYIVQKLPSSKKKRQNSRNATMDRVLNDLRDVPIAIQPSFLCKLCIFAWKKQDFVGLRMIGEKILENVEIWNVHKLNLNGDTLRKMKCLGIILVHSGFIGLGLKKEAEKYFSKASPEYTLRNTVFDDNLIQEIYSLQKLLPSTDVFDMKPNYDCATLNILHSSLVEHIHVDVSSTVCDTWWVEF